jgi:ABC-type transporter Mla subunit MlaD
VDTEKRVQRLVRSFAEIEVALRRVEGEIEADARERVRELHAEARRHLADLHAHQHEASRLLRQLATAATDDRDQPQEAIQRRLAEAQAVADELMERFAAALAHDAREGGAGRDPRRRNPR